MKRDLRDVPIWVTKEGREIPIDRMESSHLDNSIRYLRRQSLSAYGRIKLETLIAEQVRRERAGIAVLSNGTDFRYTIPISADDGWERKNKGLYKRSKPVPKKIEVIHKGKLKLGG